MEKTDEIIIRKSGSREPFTYDLFYDSGHCAFGRISTRI